MASAESGTGIEMAALTAEDVARQPDLDEAHLLEEMLAIMDRKGSERFVHPDIVGRTYAQVADDIRTLLAQGRVREHPLAAEMLDQLISMQ